MIHTPRLNGVKPVKTRISVTRTVGHLAVPFCLLSHHRSGSNFLNELIRSHSLLSSLKEPFAQHLSLFAECDIERWEAQPPPERAAWLADPFVQAYLNDLRGWLLAAPRRGFKETRLAEKLVWLEALVSPVRLILLVRDPRAVTVSILRRPHLIDYWIPVSQLAHLPPSTFRDRAEHDPVYRSALIWAHRHRQLLLEELRTRPMLLVRLEDLLAGPDMTLTRLFSFLGDLQPEPAQITLMKDLWSPARHYTASYSLRRRPQDVLHDCRGLPVHDRRTVERVCGDVMTHLGYLET